ncbi:hypothetical protein FM107_13065 [Sphingobacterium sp. JB170]|nr:hypothetical protein FM107_13065 [Sphingobacterium sp. JB170]
MLIANKFESYDIDSVFVMVFVYQSIIILMIMGKRIFLLSLSNETNISK